MAKKVQERFLDFEGQNIPVKVYRERRRNGRLSVGTAHFILRLPARLSKTKEKEYWEWFEEQACRMLQTNKQLRGRFFRRQYHSGDILTVGKRAYQLDIRYEDRKTHTARLEDGIIRLQLSQHETGLALEKSIRTLLSRIVAQDFLPEITERVHALNEKHFQKTIAGVHLKYNHSNWGSASQRRNLNFSTRLLFAPDEVIDYLIIHELAHLVEMNHSPKFWALVARAMPDYKEKERWLREHGTDCDF